ncbi:hypothetical protein [Halococcus sp. PRR34]|uniref:hypothetical protein n=1 Tax=Halococcus sp. PRR34 TaxID=3020830 RepID=UPI00235FC1B7|nr:hypothetical protein [Halococcus sp. PRR34]
MSDLDATVERLKAEATERWGDRWYLDITMWSDDDYQAHAVRSRGQTDDGATIRQRLFVSDDGETAVDQVVVEERCVEMETIESPDSEPSVMQTANSRAR